jgi:hypothetical protein
MFPDEAACADYMERVRWPDGFVCPSCGAKREPFRFAARPEVLRCRACERDTSLTAGTVMHKSRQPLHTWFWAAYLVSTQTPGMSALQFQRQLGLSRYETAFQLLHKLRAGMIRPDHDSIGDPWPVERLREMMKQAGSEVPTAATVKADTETTDGSNAGTD